MVVSHPLSVPDFIARWSGSTLSERSAAQSHFIDLCAVLGQPTPAAADQTGAFYTFEKGVHKTTGGRGFADVWLRNHFAWEYKGKHKDLAAAYQQLLTYREDLENPPLLVVCDLEHFEVHTNFTGTVKHVYRFTLTDLANPEPLDGTQLSALEILRALFTQPDRLRPNQTAAQITEVAAREFSRLAESLRDRGEDPARAAHFLMRVLFCLFAEDIGLLPENLLTHLVENTRTKPAYFQQGLQSLFAAMANGGLFGPDPIPYFNGGLFTDSDVLHLSTQDLDILLHAARMDWSSIEPAIFGTLFERSLDPAKRAQLGAHYTSREDILRIVEPVLMAPLRRQWASIQSQARQIAEERDEAQARDRERGRRTGAAATRQRDLENLLLSFASTIAAVRVLDPACGSGNFLYVALKRLLDLEKEVITFGTTLGMSRFIPQVTPAQLHGIELNEYAHELAQISVWIGYIQWLHDNGFGMRDDPILQPLHTIEQRDAILARDERGTPISPPWPEADVIIGNPPFLGGKRLRTELGDAYVNDLFQLYNGHVPREADLVTYWFERAREQIAAGKAKRAGLLATNSIRGGANRRVLQRIKETGDIFMAWDDEPWILDGAAVRISLIGFDDGSEPVKLLDGVQVAAINPDLTGALNLTSAQRLPENFGLSFMGDTKGGAFDISVDTANTMLAAPHNPNGRPNSDVVLPWVNGLDITRRPRSMWIIDFGTDMPEKDAALYELPFEHVRAHVYPERLKNNRAAYRERWWIHVEPRPALRTAVQSLRRYIATPTVAKHRLFVWLQPPTLPDHQLIVIARDDDYTLGVLHSRPHEIWALRLGTSLEDRPRYTPSTTFETFPFPWPPGQEPAGDPRVEAIAAAARDLVAKRDAWLNPEGATEAELKTRTLTNLYNQRPTWLDLAHRALDEAVRAAYGWPSDLSDDQILEILLALNIERARAG